MSDLNVSDLFVGNVSAEDLLDRLMKVAAIQKGVRVERPEPRTLVLHWRHVPTWAVILGILGLIFFLLGLIFFLVKTTETATVLARDVEGGARLTATGSTSPKMWAALHRELGVRVRHGRPDFSKLPPPPRS